MTKLSKYEKETILLTSEGDDTWDIFTFNPALKRKLTDFSLSHPDLCKLKCSTPEGSMTFTVSKPRLSLRLTKPYSEERKQKASERAKKYGLNSQRN
jgi:hypothetical protein